MTRTSGSQMEQVGTFPRKRIASLISIRGLFLFTVSLLKNPSRVGALFPSSAQLSKLMAAQIAGGTSQVLEVGAGTGSITDALLGAGLSPDRLLVIERDADLVLHLRRRFPQVRIRCGDAEHAASILREEGINQVDSIVSGIPIRNLTVNGRASVLRGMMEVMAENGQLIQFTYAANCPFPDGLLGLRAERVGRVWMNIPPAVVWKFTLRQYAQGTVRSAKARVMPVLGQ